MAYAALLESIINHDHIGSFSGVPRIRNMVGPLKLGPTRIAIDGEVNLKLWGVCIES